MLSNEWEAIVERIDVNFENLKELSKEDVRLKNVDVFFHFAWAGTSGMERADVEMQMKNVQYTYNVVKFAAEIGCKKFVNAGSIMEYEVMKNIPVDGIKPGSGTIYSTAKLTADFMAKIISTQLEISYINVIISNIYGVGERSARFLNSTLLKMLQGETIALTHGRQMYDFIYVTDAVKAIILVSKKGNVNESYYIGNRKPRPLKDFIIEMKEVVGSNSKLEFGKIPHNGIGLNYNEFDTGKLETLQFVPKISFRDGIILTMKWMLGEQDE